MKRGVAFLFFGLIIFCLCPQAYSEPLVFNLNYLLEGQPPKLKDEVNPSWLTATFSTLTAEESVTFKNAQVKLELDAGNLNSEQSVSSWLFNFKDNNVLFLNFYNDEGGPPGIDIGAQTNGFKAGSTGNFGYFDIEFPFADQLKGGFALTYFIGLGPDLLPDDFNFLNSITQDPDGQPGSFYSAAQIGEAWIATTPTTAVPESATMLLLGFGLMGMAVVGRSKFLK